MARNCLHVTLLPPPRRPPPPPPLPPVPPLSALTTMVLPTSSVSFRVEIAALAHVGVATRSASRAASPSGASGTTSRRPRLRARARGLHDRLPRVRLQRALPDGRVVLRPVRPEHCQLDPHAQRDGKQARRTGPPRTERRPPPPPSSRPSAHAASPALARLGLASRAALRPRLRRSQRSWSTRTPSTRSARSTASCRRPG